RTRSRPRGSVRPMLRDLKGEERAAYFRGIQPIWGGGLSEDRFQMFQRRLADAPEARERYRLLGWFVNGTLTAAMKAYDLRATCAARRMDAALPAAPPARAGASARRRRAGMGPGRGGPVRRGRGDASARPRQRRRAGRGLDHGCGPGLRLERAARMPGARRPDPPAALACRADAGLVRGGRPHDGGSDDRAARRERRAPRAG